MKYCKDCRWYGVNNGCWITRFLFGLLPSFVWSGEIKCFHPDSMSRKYDLVTGRRTLLSIESSHERRYAQNGSCGSDGKQFEPAPWYEGCRDGANNENVS